MSKKLEYEKTRRMTNKPRDVVHYFFFQTSLRTLNPLLEMLNSILNNRIGNDVPISNVCFSLVGLRSTSGFSAGLLLAHNSEQDRLDELKLLGPHLGMLGTLITLMVENFILKIF